METVISQDATNGHIINKYNFKVLPTDVNASVERSSNDNEFVPASKVADAKNEESASSVSDETSGDVLSKSSKDELIESLVVKPEKLG